MNPMSMFRDMRTIKKLLERAEVVARELGEEEPGAEHLLLASFDLPDGATARVLGRFDIDEAGLRRAIVGQHADALVTAGVDASVAEHLADAPALEGGPPIGPYRSKVSAQEAFQAAGDLARSSKERFGGAHVVAAVAAMEHGMAARALDRLGVDRAALADAANEDRRRPA
jgi:ATP-dependent Clp protease ATP-binding subunit ClpA